MGVPLTLGLIFLPVIFVWLLLRNGYSTLVRIVGFTWAGLFLVVVLGSPDSAPGGRGVAAPAAEKEQTAELSAEERERIDDEVSSRVNPPTDALATEERRETRYGELRIDGVENQLLFDGDVLAIDGVHSQSLGLGPVWQYGDSDLLLLQDGSGGTACPSIFVLLIAKDDGIYHSKPFGSCSDLVRATPRGRGVVLRIGSQAYFADPSGVRQIRVSEAVSEESAAELDNPSGDLSSVLRPLVEADMKMYRWCGLLEQVDVNDPKNAMFLVALGNPEFKFYAVSFKEENWRGLPLRIGGHMCVTGRYFANIEAQTVLGARKTLPALTVFRISATR